MFIIIRVDKEKKTVTFHDKNLDTDIVIRECWSLEEAKQRFDDLIRELMDYSGE